MREFILKHRIFLILSLVWFAFDQGTKYWITAHSGFIRGYYPPASGIEIIPGFFSLVYTVNPGAAWGMFAGAGGMLVLFAVIVLFIIFFFRVYLELEKPLHQVCFGLIVGGILGNTMDRIFYGYVIDFLDVHLGFYRWPTFNIADSGIVVGTLLYLVVTWSPKKHSS